MKVIGKGSTTKLEKKSNAKCRKWRLRVQTTDGEKTKRFEGTWTEAQEALKDFTADIATPISDLTFEECASTWIRRRELSGEIADSTLVKNRQQLRMLYGEFGKERLFEISKPRAEDGLLNIKHNGGKRGVTLSGTYMQQIYAIMKTVLQSAVDDGLIQKNPLEKIKPPKLDTVRRSSLSRDELARFIQVLDSMPLDTHTIGIRIAVLAGLRRGEIIGLKWQDVDAGVLRVRRSMSEHNLTIKSPKTTSGVRDVPMVELRTVCRIGHRSTTNRSGVVCQTGPLICG